MDLAYTTINLDAIAHNTALLKARATSLGSRLMCVVKADGYRHGAVEVARVMADHGADAFGVATLAEAHALRAGGITHPILAWIWSPEQDVEAAIAAGIELGVPSVAHAERVRGLGGRLCIKIDSGLRRSGVEETHWDDVFALLKEEDVSGLFTHLACADGVDDESRAAVAEQLAVFRRAISAARAAGLEVPVNHAANSPAALYYDEAAFDMLRPGLALYGAEPIPGMDHGLIPAMTWAARVVVVKPIASGEGASYGFTWRAPHDGFTAVVPIGYADGMARNAQGHVEVTIAGRRYPQVGRVCMDQIVVWLGDNAAGVTAGDEALIFGDGSRGEMTASELAAATDTINYEWLCRPTGRTVRQYTHRRVCATRQDTWQLAEEIGAQLQPGTVVLLEGPLGAGKTTFTQGLARGMNVSGRVTSPTFVLAREHAPRGSGPSLVHVDAYRLLEGGEAVDLAAELDSLDLDSELDDAVVVAEWGGGLVEQLSEKYLHIVIDRESARSDSAEDFDSDETRIISWRWCPAD